MVARFSKAQKIDNCQHLRNALVYPPRNMQKTFPVAKSISESSLIVNQTSQ